MKYIVTFSIANGDEIQIRVQAKNQAEALAKIQNRPEIVEKMDNAIGDSTIAKIDILPDGGDDEDDDLTDYAIHEVSDERYLFHHAFPHFYAKVIEGNKPLADIQFSDKCDALTAATALRKAADYIIKYRENKI